MKNGRVIFLLVIGFVFVYMIYAMMRFDSGNGDRQADSVKRIIDKALIQCYALEGSYPAELSHVDRYGVIFNDDLYIYYYEWIAGNIKPDVMVFEKRFR